MRPEPTREPGMFALVLHSHLPWLANHGRWPVGEEWLYQSWAATYLPVVDVLRRLTDEGHTRLLTLGITPVLAAQLDDPHSLTGMHHWLGNWKLRAHEAAGMAEPSYRALGAREHRAADWALESFETRWRHGGSPVIRELIDADTIELLGGPLAHPFQPLLDPRLRAFSLSEGLEDAHQRWHHTPRGIWGPNADSRRAWRRVTPQRVSSTSWSTDRRCTATPHSGARSASPTSCVSAAICRSHTGCGLRSPDTPDIRHTATSTPIATTRVSSPHASPDVPSHRRTRPRTTPTSRRRLSIGTSRTSSTPSGSDYATNRPASGATPSSLRRSTPNCSGTGVRGTDLPRTTAACTARSRDRGRHALRRTRSRIRRRTGGPRGLVLGIGEGLAGVGR